jgi:hypothetical protein
MNSSPANKEPKDEAKINHQVIREELARVLESPIFAQSERLARFLRFTVETTLAGEGATLKEYLIGTEVYDRKPPYHPSVDSIVRSEARRLRGKLRQYYESAGTNDPVFIYYRTGSYVPAFRHHRADNCMHAPIRRALDDLLTEELITRTLDLSSTDQKFEVRIIFEGTVRIVRSEPATAAPAPCASVKNIFGPSSTSKVVSVSAANPLRLKTSHSVPPRRALVPSHSQRRANRGRKFALTTSK